MSRHAAPGHFKTSNNVNFPAYDPAVYHRQKADVTDDNSAAMNTAFVPRRAGAGHFQTTSRDVFKPIPAEIYEAELRQHHSATSDKNAGPGGGNSNSPPSARVRHVPKEHFSTSSRTEFKAYDPKEYTRSLDVGTAGGAEGAEAFHMRHASSSHFATTNREAFQKYGRAEMASSRPSTTASKSHPTSGGEACAEFKLRHATPEHFTTMSKAMFPKYDASAFKREQDEQQSAQQQAAYNPRHVGKDHFKTSKQMEFPDYSVPAVAESSA